MPKLESQAPKLVNRGGAGLLSKVGIATTNGRAEHIANLLSSAKKNNVRCEGTVVSISSLKPDPDNARLHPERNMEAIKLSLAQFGQLHPIVVRLETRVVMAGNGRLEAAKQLGWSKIAASLIPMTEAEAAAYGLADNRTSELATWDFETVARLDRLVQEAGLEQVGWSAEELTALRMQQSVTPEADPDDVPPVPVVPVSRLGDLWTLGEHRLLCGDSADKSAIKILMGVSKACLLATDPPYGVEFGKANHNPTAKVWNPIKGDNRAGAELREWLADVLKKWLVHCTLDMASYTWSAPLAEGHRFYEAIIDAGLHVQSQVVWAKNVFAMGQADYQWKHEPCWYAFFKGQKHRWYGGRDKTTVWDVKRLASSSYLHPMQKPVELYATPMEHHTLPGDIVAEPFAGSGTQLIAAQTLGRRCYAMELDPIYCDVALQRWSTFTGGDPVREDGAKFSELIAERDAGQVEE